MAVFTPPQIQNVPAFLPETRGLARRLFRYFPNRWQFVTVFYLSNGTFVQDYPTPANQNTAVPYPQNPYAYGSPYLSVSYYDYTLNQPIVVDTALPVFPLFQFGYGAQEVSSAMATLLSAAGYAGN